MIRLRSPSAVCAAPRLSPTSFGTATLAAAGVGGAVGAAGTRVAVGGTRVGVGVGASVAVAAARVAVGGGCVAVGGGAVGRLTTTGWGVAVGVGGGDGRAAPKSQIKPSTSATRLARTSDSRTSGAPRPPRVGGGRPGAERTGRAARGGGRRTIPVAAPGPAAGRRPPGPPRPSSTGAIRVVRWRTGSVRPGSWSTPKTRESTSCGTARCSNVKPATSTSVRPRPASPISKNAGIVSAHRPTIRIGAPQRTSARPNVTARRRDPTSATAAMPPIRPPIPSAALR